MNAPRNRARWVRGVVAFGVMLAVAGCSDEVPPTRDRAVAPAPPAPAKRPPQPSLRVPGDPLVRIGWGHTGAGQPGQIGTADVEVSTSSLEGGRVVPGPRHDGARSLVFPDFHRTGGYPRAVVVVHNGSAKDQLNPDARDFAFGADVSLDGSSFGRSEDNGNNILQRGLSSDPVMFKVDLDASLRPGCMVKGRGGLLVVHSSRQVTPGRWYRIRCERRGNRLFVTMGQFLPSGATWATAREAKGRIGAMHFPGPEVPVSVGGKVAHDGTVIRSETDQFNGRIANPYFDVR